MKEIITKDEAVKWEYMISKQEKLVATNKRLYRLNTKATKISVLFRKAILGCEYTFRNMWPIAITLLILGVLVYLSASNDNGKGIAVVFVIGSFFFMNKVEKLSIKVSGEGHVKLYKIAWFSPKYQPTLIEKIPDISALEDV